MQDYAYNFGLISLILNNESLTFSIESDITIIELDEDTEKECEYCKEYFAAKDLSSHQDNCIEYLKKIEEDINKNKFTAIKP